MKCIGYTKSGPANIRQSGGVGYTRKAILFLPIVIQLTSLVLCEGVGVGVGVGKGVWRWG